jgi:LysM repeat protein
MTYFRRFLLLLFLAGLLVTALPAAADTTYVVQPGDTLSKIAAQYGVTVQAIAEANNIVNPNLIHAGQRLVIPGVDGPVSGTTSPQPTAAAGGGTATGNQTYVVQPGDTLSAIAVRFRVTVQAIVQANNIANPSLILSGQTLIIPGGSATGTTPATTPAATAGAPAATSAAPSPTQPPAPTQAPAPSSANLLPNPSFEEGYYNLYGAPELQVPAGWSMEIDEGGVTAPDTGEPFIRPESRIAPRWGLPPAEVPLFLYSGDWTIKVFKGGHPISFRLFTTVNLSPGTYRFTASYFPDLVVAYEGGSKVWSYDPLAGEVRFIRGGGGSGWMSVTTGVKNTMSQTFSVSAAGPVTVGVAFRTRYVLANNGFFIDDWSLQRVGP